MSRQLTLDELKQKPKVDLETLMNAVVEKQRERVEDKGKGF